MNKQTTLEIAVTKELGNIRSVRIGMGGYQEAMFGAWFDLGGKSWGVSDGRGTWARDPDKYCKWSTQDQDREFANTMRYVMGLCREAKVDDVSRLKGVPVEVEFENMRLKSWRILKEVL